MNATEQADRFWGERVTKVIKSFYPNNLLWL